jgi:3-oxoacyl-[acyl-carrier protein] reductase
MAKIGEQQMMDSLAGNEPSVHLDLVTTTTDEEWRRMLGVHLDGTFFCTRAALPLMYDRPGACIINMGSIMGTVGGAGAAAYCAAKAGILGLTRSLARELASRRIRVNALAPGWIDTDMTAPLEAMHASLKVQTPLGRLGDTEDIAAAAAYLASEDAKFMTGQVLSPNGGWAMNQ